MKMQDNEILNALNKALNDAFPCPPSENKSEQCYKILNKVTRQQRQSFLQRFSIAAVTAAAILILTLTTPWNTESSWDIPLDIAYYYYPEALPKVEFDISRDVILEYLIDTETPYQLTELIEEYVNN
ncbi:MAG: hypothetical protein PHE86_04230 [Candidatus Marinimicrobia bacterium]|nr:hypothetical protein [Candidatus Neomarinimicrobiota bacterium]MDD5583196.1 hypothetical protein [Candidatus Neomarinimicrobiota bacterium]